MEEFYCIFCAEIVTSHQEALLCGDATDGNTVVVTLALTEPHIDRQ